MPKTKVDLFTGFLGAGKTTFLTRYLTYLNQEKVTTILIENEFGKAGVDAQILKKVPIHMKELSGGCICCGLKVNFHNLLIESAKKYEHIVVEPTGIYTVEDFFDVMLSPSVAQYCEIGTIITIVDPSTLLPSDESLEKIFYSQIAYSGLIIVSKSEYSSALYDLIHQQLTYLLQKYSKLDTVRVPPILLKNWDTLTDQDYASVAHCGYSYLLPQVSKETHAYLFFSIMIKPHFASDQELKTFLADAMRGQFGALIRLKGYVYGGNTIYEVNCTSHHMVCKNVTGDYHIGLNLISQKIDRKELAQYLNRLHETYA